MNAWRASTSHRHSGGVACRLRAAAAAGQASPAPSVSMGCALHPAIANAAMAVECLRGYGAMFSAFPATVFNTLPRGCPVSAFEKVIASPCLSYFEHGLFGRSFQSVQPVLPFIVHVPCHITPFAVLYSALPSAA